MSFTSSSDQGATKRQRPAGESPRPAARPALPAAASRVPGSLRSCWRLGTRLWAENRVTNAKGRTRPRTGRTSGSRGQLDGDQDRGAEGGHSHDPGRRGSGSRRRGPRHRGPSSRPAASRASPLPPQAERRRAARRGHPIVRVHRTVATRPAGRRDHRAKGARRRRRARPVPACDHRREQRPRARPSRTSTPSRSRRARRRAHGRRSRPPGHNDAGRRPACRSSSTRSGTGVTREGRPRVGERDTQGAPLRPESGPPSTAAPDRRRSKVIAAPWPPGQVVPSTAPREELLPGMYRGSSWPIGVPRCCRRNPSP